MVFPASSCRLSINTIWRCYPPRIFRRCLYQGLKKNHFLPAVCSCVHGVCNSGLDGNGTCECYSAYTGPHCDKRKYRQFPQCHTRSKRHRCMYFRQCRPVPSPGGCCSMHPLLSPVCSNGSIGLAIRGWSPPLHPAQLTQEATSLTHTQKSTTLLRACLLASGPRTPSESWLLAPPCGWPPLEGRFRANLTIKAS